MDWEDIKTFAAVARHGTVRRAGAALRVHHSTVSRRLERLEQDVSVRLLDRRPEGLMLTEAGEELLTVAEQMEGSLFNVERQIAGRDAELSGQLTVTLPEPLASHVLVPRLDRFIAECPALDLRVLATGDLLDVSRREAEVAIRCDNNPPETLVGKRLFPYYVTVYAAEGYLEQRDLAAQPEAGRWLGFAADEGRYPEWAADTEFGRVPAWGVFPELATQIAAVKAGIGLAILPCLVGDATPGLVRATQRDPVPSRDIWVLTHRDLRRTARIRAFMQFAETVLQECRPQLTGSVT
ncbi:MAG: LysR family transcriptional regulator [Pseudomonadota bacterium]